VYQLLLLYIKPVFIFLGYSFIYRNMCCGQQVKLICNYAYLAQLFFDRHGLQFAKKVMAPYCISVTKTLDDKSQDKKPFYLLYLKSRHLLVIPFVPSGCIACNI